MAKILVVDDEPLLVKGIKFNLENEGHQVTGCHDGEAGLSQAETGEFDLIILDLMMPKMGGLDCCMAIRGFSTVPIIMLTAKGEDTDKIIGFEYGADDYLTKPFNILELKARVRALLRRAGRSQASVPEVVTESVLKVGHILLDPVSRSVKRGEENVELTAKEFNLMELLMENPERVYSRESLLNLVWGMDYLGDDRTVDVHVRRLREKLELDPASPQYLKTKWGVGYYLNKEEEG
ncbi:MAG: response regulator transcription factor [Eubacteriales bacterium]